MKEIIETTQLEFEKSTFVVDIVKHKGGKRYVEINQTIHKAGSNMNCIKINPSVLMEIIEVLQNYRSQIFEVQNIGKYHLKEKTKDDIQNRYLRGVPLKELALQFGYSEKLIEMILRNRGVEIVSNDIPKKRWRRRKRKY